MKLIATNFFLFGLIISSLSNIILNRENSRIPETICNLVNTIAAGNDINTAVVIGLETNITESIIKDSIECLPKSVKVIVINLIRQNESVSLRSKGWKKLETNEENIEFMNINAPQNSLIIMFTDNLERVSL